MMLNDDKLEDRIDPTTCSHKPGSVYRWEDPVMAKEIAMQLGIPGEEIYGAHCRVCRTDYVLVVKDGGLHPASEIKND